MSNKQLHIQLLFSGSQMDLIIKYYSIKRDTTLI